MDHIKLDEQMLAETYLAGLLPPETRAAFEVHLVGCEECQDRVLLAEMFQSRGRRPSPSAAPSEVNGGGASQLEGPSASDPQHSRQQPSNQQPSNQQQPSVPQRRDAEASRTNGSLGQGWWSASESPARPAREIISYRPVPRTVLPARSRRRWLLAAGVLFAACAGYLAGAGTPMLHGPAAGTITPYSVTGPARTREEALARIIEQSNVVLGGERITLALIRSATPRDEQSDEREYRDHAKRLREYYDIFRKEYESLQILYKTNKSILQEGDSVFLEDAMTGAENVERNMQQLKR